MEQVPEIKISIDRAESPSPDYDIDSIKHWVESELEFRDQTVRERLKVLDEKIDAQRGDIESHKEDTKQGIQNTRIALAATTITTLGGIATALITFFATKYVNNTSN